MHLLMLELFRIEKVNNPFQEHTIGPNLESKNKPEQNVRHKDIYYVWLLERIIYTAYRQELVSQILMH